MFCMVQFTVFQATINANTSIHQLHSRVTALGLLNKHQPTFSLQNGIPITQVDLGTQNMEANGSMCHQLFTKVGLESEHVLRTCQQRSTTVPQIQRYFERALRHVTREEGRKQKSASSRGAKFGQLSQTSKTSRLGFLFSLIRKKKARGKIQI